LKPKTEDCTDKIPRKKLQKGLKENCICSENVYFFVKIREKQTKPYSFEQQAQITQGFGRFYDFIFRMIKYT